VTLELDGDDPMVLGQDRDNHSEAQLRGEQATVEQYERRSFPTLVVIEVESVDIGVGHTNETIRASSTHR
jgi:hypothetical protein